MSSADDVSHAAAMPAHQFDAVIFDLDGVLTRTARIHAAAWKVLFDDYLKMRQARDGEPFRPFELERDYLAYVDGKPRYEGVRSFLASRHLHLPEGAADDGPDQETIHGLGDKKDHLFEQLLHQKGVEVYHSTVALIRDLKAAGVKVAVVSSSLHCREVLELAGLEGLFAARVDGVLARKLDLTGKPHPDIFLKAAELLQVDPQRAVVVEDAVSGVQAGRRGGFGLVIGIDRGHNRQALLQNGAHHVVSDLSQVSIEIIDDWFPS